MRATIKQNHTVNSVECNTSFGWVCLADGVMMAWIEIARDSWYILLVRKWRRYLWHSELHSPHFLCHFWLCRRMLLRRKHANWMGGIWSNEWRSPQLRCRTFTLEFGIRDPYMAAESIAKLFNSLFTNRIVISISHSRITLSNLRERCVHSLSYYHWLAVIPTEMKTLLASPVCAIYFRW